MLTADDSESHAASVSILVVVLVAISIYAFGYARAVMHRANRDYKTTKAAVPTLRKGFWLAWWGAVKVSFWIVVVFLVFGVWAWHSIHQPGKAADISPSPSVSHSTSHKSASSPSRHRNG